MRLSAFVTTAELFESYAQHLARVGDLPMRVGRVDDRWRLAICDRGWRVIDHSIAVFDDLADSVELTRIRDWLQRDVLRVREVALHPDTRRPGTFMVTVEG